MNQMRRFFAVVRRWTLPVILATVVIVTTWLGTWCSSHLTMLDLGIPLPSVAGKRLTVGLRMRSDGPLMLAVASTVHDPQVEAQENEQERRSRDIFRKS